MTDHSYFEENLEDYARGLLSEKEQAAVYSHIIGCDNCQEELKFLDHYFNSVTKMEAPLPAADFLTRVRRKIDALPQKKFEAVKAKIKKPFVNWRLVGLVCSCLIVIAVLIVHQSKLPHMAEETEKPLNAPKNLESKENAPQSNPEDPRTRQNLTERGLDTPEESQTQREDKPKMAPSRKAAPTHSFEDAREAGRLAREKAKGQQNLMTKSYQSPGLTEEKDPLPELNTSQKLENRSPEKVPQMDFEKKGITVPENDNMQARPAPSLSQEPMPAQKKLGVRKMEMADQSDQEAIEAKAPELIWSEKHWVWHVSRKDSAKVELEPLLKIIEGNWDSKIFKKEKQRLDFYIPREQIRPLLKRLIIAGYRLKENNQAHQLQDIFIRLRF